MRVLWAREREGGVGQSSEGGAGGVTVAEQEVKVFQVWKWRHHRCTSRGSVGVMGVRAMEVEVF